MLKRCSSLILAFVVGSSVLAGTARVRDEHVCEMVGREALPCIVTTSCCQEDQTKSVSGSQEQCCITIPRETAASGTTFNLRPSSLSIDVPRPLFVQAHRVVLDPHSTKVFLPNLQASYIRNHALLI